MQLSGKQRVVQIPGSQFIGDETCGTPPNCCVDIVTPGDWDCSEPLLGDLPSSAIITLTGATGGQSGYFGIFELGTPDTVCGYDYTPGFAHYVTAWANGSYGLNYVGKFNGTEIDGCDNVYPISDCDFHVYASSQTEIDPGFLFSDDTPPLVSYLNAAPASCCCGDNVNLYRDRTDNQLYMQYTSDRSMCATEIGNLNMPCEIEYLYDGCDGTSPIWISQPLIEACIGQACPPCCLVPNGDVYGGLYCDDPVSGSIAQYPFRVSVKLFRQAILLIPQDTLSNDSCCLNGVLFLKTFIVRRRWLDDGTSRISGEPTVLEYERVTAITFASNGSIEGTGSFSVGPVCSLWPCYDLLHTQDVELNAGS